MNLVISRAEAKAKGLKVYYTGKPCKHGHVSERRVDNGACEECAKRRYQDNREKITQRMAQYYRDNAETLKQYQKQHARDNAETIAKQRKQYRKDNREKFAQKDRRYQKDNAEKIAQYRKDNAEKIAQYRKQYHEQRYWQARQELADSLGIKLEDLRRGGYQPSRPGTFYIVKIVTRYDEYLGFGITNNLKKRIINHRWMCKKAGATLELLETFDDEDGYGIAEIERNVKESVQIYDTGIEGFKTEACIYSDENLERIRNNMYYYESELQAA